MVLVCAVSQARAVLANYVEVQYNLGLSRLKSDDDKIATARQRLLQKALYSTSHYSSSLSGCWCVVDQWNLVETVWKPSGNLGEAYKQLGTTEGKRWESQEQRRNNLGTY